MMKKLSVIAIAAGLAALSACNSSPREQAADNIEANAEASADNLEEAADNAGTEAGEATLENQADAVRATGQNQAGVPHRGCGVYAPRESGAPFSVMSVATSQSALSTPGSAQAA